MKKKSLSRFTKWKIRFANPHLANLVRETSSPRVRRWRLRPRMCSGCFRMFSGCPRLGKIVTFVRFLYVCTRLYYACLAFFVRFIPQNKLHMQYKKYLYMSFYMCFFGRTDEQIGRRTAEKIDRNKETNEERKRRWKSNGNGKKIERSTEILRTSLHKHATGRIS